jgi:hypothetical protein
MLQGVVATGRTTYQEDVPTPISLPAWPATVRMPKHGPIPPLGELAYTHLQRRVEQWG